MQAYKGLNVTRNKVPVHEHLGDPYHLLGFVDPNKDYELKDFCHEVFFTIIFFTKIIYLYITKYISIQYECFNYIYFYALGFDFANWKFIKTKNISKSINLVNYIFQIGFSSIYWFIGIFSRTCFWFTKGEWRVVFIPNSREITSFFCQIGWPHLISKDMSFSKHEPHAVLGTRRHAVIR